MNFDDEIQISPFMLWKSDILANIYSYTDKRDVRQMFCRLSAVSWSSMTQRQSLVDNREHFKSYDDTRVL